MLFHNLFAGDGRRPRSWVVAAVAFSLLFAAGCRTENSEPDLEAARALSAEDSSSTVAPEAGATAAPAAGQEAGTLVVEPAGATASSVGSDDPQSTTDASNAPSTEANVTAATGGADSTIDQGVTTTTTATTAASTLSTSTTAAPITTRSTRATTQSVTQSTARPTTRPPTTRPTTAPPTTQPTTAPPAGTHPDIVRVIAVPGRTPGGEGWMDSYSVDNRCYCATNFDHNIGGIQVDTPAGRRSVRQVCDRIGDGPGHQGRPIYNDVQCGNGPANDAGDEDECPGRVDIGRQGCGHIGPRWDLTVFQ